MNSQDVLHVIALHVVTDIWHVIGQAHSIQGQHSVTPVCWITGSKGNLNYQQQSASNFGVAI